MIEETLNENELDENVDLVEVNIEKPLWRSIQALRYKIERREKQIETIEEEIELLYQEISHLRSGCQAGDIMIYKSDPNKIKIVLDVEAIDYEDAFVYMDDIDEHGYPVGKIKQYPSDIMINYEVIGKSPLDMTQYI